MLGQAPHGMYCRLCSNITMPPVLPCLGLIHCIFQDSVHPPKFSTPAAAAAAAAAAGLQSIEHKNAELARSVDECTSRVYSQMRDLERTVAKQAAALASYKTSAAAGNATIAKQAAALASYKTSAAADKATIAQQADALASYKTSAAAGNATIAKQAAALASYKTSTAADKATIAQQADALDSYEASNAAHEAAKAKQAAAIASLTAQLAAATAKPDIATAGSQADAPAAAPGTGEAPAAPAQRPSIGSPAYPATPTAAGTAAVTAEVAATAATEEAQAAAAFFSCDSQYSCFENLADAALSDVVQSSPAGVSPQGSSSSSSGSLQKVRSFQLNADAAPFEMPQHSSSSTMPFMPMMPSSIMFCNGLDEDGERIWTRFVLKTVCADGMCHCFWMPEQ
jgi:hypothetical protein